MDEGSTFFRDQIGIQVKTFSVKMDKYFFLKSNYFHDKNLTDTFSSTAFYFVGQLKYVMQTAENACWPLIFFLSVLFLDLSGLYHKNVEDFIKSSLKISKNFITQFKKCIKFAERQTQFMFCVRRNRYTCFQFSVKYSV